MSNQPSPPPFQTALLAGALAGTTVDLSLFPLDTLKTRLQSADGFFAAGGFRGIYRGVHPSDARTRVVLALDAPFAPHLIDIVTAV